MGLKDGQHCAVRRPAGAVTLTPDGGEEGGSEEGGPRGRENREEVLAIVQAGDDEDLG